MSFELLVYTVSTTPFFFGAINDVSMEVVLFDSESSIFKFNAFELFDSDTISCDGIDSGNSLAPNLDGVCDRDVARDEHRDDGLEFLD